MIGVVYIRCNGGKRLAALIRRGTGPDRGLVWVRSWSLRESKLRRLRAVPKEMLMGRPRKSDPQIAAIKMALRNERKAKR